MGRLLHSLLYCSAATKELADPLSTNNESCLTRTISVNMGICTPAFPDANHLCVYGNLYPAFPNAFVLMIVDVLLRDLLPSVHSREIEQALTVRTYPPWHTKKPRKERFWSVDHCSTSYCRRIHQSCPERNIARQRYPLI